MITQRKLNLFVDNEIGVLTRIAGLFSGKSCNLSSLTVGATQHTAIAHMTISLSSDDQMYEQIKKQLERMIEVIHVIDCAAANMHMKELMLVKLFNCTDKDIQEITRISSAFDIKLTACTATTVLIESVQTEHCNNDLIGLFKRTFADRMEFVRGGNVAMQAN